MSATNNKTQLFNNSIQESTLKMHDTLGPAVALLAPKLLFAADAAASFATSLLGGQDPNSAGYENTGNKSMDELKTFQTHVAMGTDTDEDRAELAKRERVTQAALVAAKAHVDMGKEDQRNFSPFAPTAPEQAGRVQAAEKLQAQVQAIHDALGGTGLTKHDTKIGNPDELATKIDAAVGAEMRKAPPKGIVKQD